MKDIYVCMCDGKTNQQMSGMYTVYEKKEKKHVQDLYIHRCAMAIDR